MNILMLAPEPFFQPRGTPISVYLRIKALTDLGHKVDLVTYHLGEDKTMSGLTILRTSNLFGIKKIKIGPSLKKIPLDLLLMLKAAGRLVKGQYDLIFSHEEAALFGVILGRLWRIPHLYDMHSSLPQQLENFDFSRSRLLKKIFLRMEKMILRNSESVIVICPDLQKTVESLGFGAKAVLLENIIEIESPIPSHDDVARKRKTLGLENKKVVLYAGNFQPYQGIPLLLEAAARISDERVAFLLVGESPPAVQRTREAAAKLGISDRIFFTGQVPPTHMPLYLELADALVSPRLSGTNTPLKIYSFLKTGKPLVATRLWTHTQILDDDIAVLVDPDPESMATGLRFALFDPAGASRARTAREMAARNYTIERYQERINLALSKTQGKKESGTT